MLALVEKNGHDSKKRELLLLITIELFHLTHIHTLRYASYMLMQGRVYCTVHKAYRTEPCNWSSRG